MLKGIVHDNAYMTEAYEPSQ